MPKIKTKAGAKKRFKLTGSGKLKRKHAFKSHILTKKETKQKHNLTKTGYVHESDVKSVKAQLGIQKIVNRLLTRYIVQIRVKDKKPLSTKNK